MHTAGVPMARGGCGCITGNGVSLGTAATSTWSHRDSHSVLRRSSVRIYAQNVGCPGWQQSKGDGHLPRSSRFLGATVAPGAHLGLSELVTTC